MGPTWQNLVEPGSVPGAAFDKMYGDNAARTLVNETEEEALEFRDRFVDVMK